MNSTMVGRTSRMVVAAVGLLAAVQVSAGPISWFKRSPFWPFGQPETLIVAGNYAEPRLLAEIAQFKTKQPVIIISPEAGGDRFYYLPLKGDTALQLADQAQYVEMVETVLRPKKKRIVFLGDERMIPAKYIEPFRKNYTVLTFEGDDWVKNAKELGRTLDCWSMRRSFEKYLRKMVAARAHRETYDPDGKTISYER